MLSVKGKCERCGNEEELKFYITSYLCSSCIHFCEKMQDEEIYNAIQTLKNKGVTIEILEHYYKM
jgi:late competence protein required for DNA uptake (superfamily II DNA/RNA helicase)